MKFIAVWNILHILKNVNIKKYFSQFDKYPWSSHKVSPESILVLSPTTSRFINPLTPNDHYSGRTARLTSKRCILSIYSTNIGTEYFKHGIHSPFFLFKMQFVS